ncbi:hypothetical protein LTR37_001901 [Vermiconidia calcicola]|uniref:Uncharacterized protein n=1 Tax=Vermiconidia calcicola TaxID=1690605 RepID=A0ACC3NVG7_9PEZI|nr:hypothetical protein LTR37_001901 [Vermiconidia calcicola]
MNTSDNPSIFTAPEAFNKRPIGLSQPSLHTRTSSPFRRQSTPDPVEKNCAQVAAEVTPLFITSPVNNFIPTVNAGLGEEELDNTKAIAHCSIWSSFQSNEKERGTVTPGGGKTRERSASASQAVRTTPPKEQSLPTVPHNAGQKRPAATTPLDDRGPTSAPSRRKRPRFNGRLRGEHCLHTFPTGFHPNTHPPSPLFFSNSPQQRPTLPPRFSSSEAAAKMLCKTRQEDSHVKTVSLARGVVSTPSIPTNAFLQNQQSPGSRASSERNVTIRSKSPEAVHTPREISHVLNSIGIIELLEQDERPTFIVDLGDKSNYGPGPLRLVYASSSLRSYEGLESLMAGSVPEEALSGQHTHLQFKSWVVSGAIHGESLDVCLPSFQFANMTWHCSTLRRRLRIISGAFIPASGSSRPPTRRSSVPSADMRSTDGIPSTDMTMLEPNDYFGKAAPPSRHKVTSNGSSSTNTSTTEVLPTIEEPMPAADARSTTSRGANLDTENASLMPTDRDLSESTQLLPNSSSTYVPTSTAIAPTSPNEISSPAGSSDRPSSHVSMVPSDAPSFDWTRLPVTDSMPRHIQFARSIDWAATALGPIENWNPDLRQMCNLIMASPHPAAMYWGEDLIAIYNEAYILLAGQKHPSLMGQSYQAAWSEIWDDVKDVFASARVTGEATMKDDDCLFIKRNDFLEETYFSWSIIPMVGREGSVMGLYNPAFEKTRRKIAERRMLTLREIGERTASARDVKGFWEQVLDSFEFNEYDSPFLLLYSVTEDNDSDSISIHSNSVYSTRQCLLEGSLGIPEDHPAATDQIDLKSGTNGFGPVFREVMNTDKPVLLEVGSRDLPESLLQGLELRGFGDRVRAVVVCPIHPTTGENVLGFLVLGVNPRRPYDDDYALFVQLLSRQLATSLASVVLFEEEIRRGQKAAKLAALDRMELSEQLAARTQEAIESETKFTRMAEFAPVGMFIADSGGNITFANDTWYDISRVPKNSSMADTWMDAVKPEDYGIVRQLWDDLVVGTKAVSSEFRFKAQWQDRSGNRGDTWALFSGYPEKSEDGRLKSIFGSITNISQQKWAEGIQTRKMEEAVELKRQQENFIDITSHEMRNPLSAILQCSDEITNNLNSFRKSGNQTMLDDLLTSCLDAAQIINLCSQHQKRIVDDILTLSKLDSQLLLVTPVDAQPLTVVQRALKMHEGELQASDIQMRFVVDQTYRDLNLDWVRLDPSRVLQVLINLTTNAIKFTSSEKKRTITVTIAACRDRPSDRKDVPVSYFATRRKGRDVLDEKEWGEGEKVYIHFSVKDTGRGLNPEEKKLLFMRFSQASPRTHVQYGGSGLGLFISRELTELQGGEIGVESESGKGSTFAFYIVARRSTPPPEADAGTGHGRGRQDPKSKPVPSTAIKKATDGLANASIADSNGTTTPARKPTKKKVLIVEDNLVNQKVLQKQLKNEGTEVHVANHGGEAIEKLRQSTYWAGGGSGPKLELGVVLMDQEMPVMDGLTCTRKIREMEKEGMLTGHVPIIAVTANARAEQVQTALDAGMDDVVSKPFRIPDLVPKIEELMERFPMPSPS